MKEKKQSKEQKTGFFKHVKAELKKIIWPDRKSVVKQTVLIIVTIAILGVIVSFLDKGVSLLIGLLA